MNDPAVGTLKSIRLGFARPGLRALTGAFHSQVRVEVFMESEVVE